MAEEILNSVPVRILFFAQAREQTKLRESYIVFKRDSLKARELLDGIIETFPGLKPLENCLIIARNRTYLDFESDDDILLKAEDELAVIPPISAEFRNLVKTMDIAKLVANKIDIEEVVTAVSSSTCGATSMFIGTTRDYFENKKVIRLEYEAYEPMAVVEIKKICEQIRSKWNVEHIAVVHRLGVVPVKEASVIIAISSAHRKESLEAVQFAIDSLKASVPIWKKEVYEEEGAAAEWKANPECQWKEIENNLPSSLSENKNK